YSISTRGGPFVKSQITNISRLSHLREPSQLFVFTGFVVSYNLLQRFSGKKRLGEFPIHPLLFVAGKLSMGISWGFLFVRAAGMQLALFPIPAALEYVSAVLLLLGIAFVISAFLHLGSDSRLGVSDDSGGLRTTGIYRVSRNPMYLGFYLVTLASLVSVPHPVNIGCGLVGVYVHHRIVLAEERFLLKAHGASYEAYRRRVRRYM
ncbi:MAG: isoprenylcysteine carboxylmethyltransferase family protein, partial [Anaerolineae bacterium]|nr:isoprenylcysteine carboxylmethyltransferase family protein [Anaerolineae bacterium]